MFRITFFAVNWPSFFWSERNFAFFTTICTYSFMHLSRRRGISSSVKTTKSTGFCETRITPGLSKIFSHLFKLLYFIKHNQIIVKLESHKLILQDKSENILIIIIGNKTPFLNASVFLLIIWLSILIKNQTIYPYF